MLRPLVNQPQITLFMATIGLAFFIEGLAQMMWGANVRGLDLGLQDEPMQWLSDRFGMSISKFDLAAAGVAAVLVTSLALFFSRTRIGRALRAVADDHQAALAVGIPLQQIWGIVWGVAGFVALVAGLLWGARNGVQFALTFVALKALPVLILGGFESVPGAIVGGLIIGASEKLAEVYIGPMRRRRHRRLVPVRAGAALPAGAARRPVRRKDHSPHLTTDEYTNPCSIAKPASSRPPTSTMRRSFRSGRTGSASPSSWLLAFVAVPLFATPYLFSAILIPFLILALAAIGLNILTGYAGQLSLGTAAFMAVGAFASYNFMLRVPGMPILLAFVCGGLMAARRRHPVRPAEPAHPRLLPGGGHAGRAVLHRLVPDQGRLVLQLQLVGRHHRAAGRDPRLRSSRRRRRSTCWCWSSCA